MAIATTVIRAGISQGSARTVVGWAEEGTQEEFATLAIKSAILPASAPTPGEEVLERDLVVDHRSAINAKDSVTSPASAPVEAEISVIDVGKEVTLPGNAHCRTRANGVLRAPTWSATDVVIPVTWLAIVPINYTLC